MFITPSARFIKEETRELLQLLAAKEVELGKHLTMNEKNDLLIPFITEHEKELASHAFAALQPNELEELRSGSRRLHPPPNPSLPVPPEGPPS